GGRSANAFNVAKVHYKIRIIWDGIDRNGDHSAKGIGLILLHAFDAAAQHKITGFCCHHFDTEICRLTRSDLPTKCLDAFSETIRFQDEFNLLKGQRSVVFELGLNNGSVTSNQRAWKVQP